VVRTVLDAGAPGTHMEMYWECYKWAHP